VRVHRTSQGFKPSPRDVAAPWISAWIPPSSSDSACLELTLVPNPWSAAAPEVAPAGNSSYAVRVELAP
jgi:hypothetical protein